MVEAPPSKNHKTRIPFWHPRNNKPPCGSLVTTLLTSLRHAGGEADAISLLCFALIVYQTISDLSTGKSRNFFFFLTFYTNMCVCPVFFVKIANMELSEKNLQIPDIWL